MALVAKVYEGYPQVGSAYTREEDNKNYIDVLTEDGEIKSVRVYTIEQYNFLLGMQYQKDKMAEERRKVAESYNEERKINAGFKEGYIIAVLGDTYDHKEFLKNSGAKFSNSFKWYFEGGKEPVHSLEKTGYKTFFNHPVRKITWEEASEEIENGCIRLKPVNELAKLLEFEYERQGTSEHKGILGDFYSGLFHLYNRDIIDGSKGRHALNFLKDNKGNVFLWNTSIKDMPDYGIYSLGGIVAGHTTYRGERQTILADVVVI